MYYKKSTIEKKKEQERHEERDIDAAHFVPPEIPPDFARKNEYLYYVGAKDCVKDKVKWRYGFQLVQKTYGKEQQNPKKQKEKKPKESKAISIKLSGSEMGSVTKVERKVLREKRKRVLKVA